MISVIGIESSPASRSDHNADGNPEIGRQEDWFFLPLSFSTRVQEEGKQFGIQLGVASMPLSQLDQKLGTIPIAVRERVQKADADTLLRWSSRVLNVSAVDTVPRSARCEVTGQAGFGSYSAAERQHA